MNNTLIDIVGSIQEFKDCLERNFSKDHLFSLSGDKNPRELRKEILLFLNSNVELLDVFIDLIESFAKQSNLIDAELNLVGGDNEWIRLRNIAERMHRRIVVLDPPSENELDAALRWMSEKGQKEELVLLKKLQNDSIDMSPDLHDLLMVVIGKLENRLHPESIQIIPGGGQYRVDCSLNQIIQESQSIQGFQGIRIIESHSNFIIIEAPHETTSAIGNFFQIQPLEPSNEVQNPKFTNGELRMNHIRDRVVSFKAPIHQSVKQKIREMGAVILQPLSGSEIVVSVANEAVAQQLVDLEEVAQVTPYVPRINVQPRSFQNSKQPATKEAISAARLKAAKNVNQSQSRINTIPGILVAEFFTAEDRDRALQNLETAGVRIADVSGDKLLVIDVSSDSNPNESLRLASEQVGLQSIEEKVMPRLFNERAATVMGTSVVASPPQPTIGLTGKGEIIAIADTGLDTGDPELLHPDFQGRVIDITSYPIAKGWSKYLSNLGDDDGPSDKYSGHGTHVAGSALGNGAQARKMEIAAIPMGIASEAQLVFQALEQTAEWTLDGISFYLKNSDTMPPPSGLFGIPEDLTELFQYAYEKGSRIHSNSWGGGNPGEYNNQCKQVDQFVWDNPDFLIVIAAGNDGKHSSSGTSGIDQGSVTPPATAKNCLTVGASENDRSHQFSDTYGQGNPICFPYEPFHSDGLVDYIDDIAAFSSRGPLVNGYRKPDVIAPGTFILSTRSSRIATNNFADGAYLPAKYHYMYMTGTSMATPLVAGCAALVRQYLKERHQPAISNPSAALVKAVLIHSAQYIDYRHAHPASEPWADNEQGWGRINLQTVLNPVAPTQLIVNDESSGLRTNQDCNYKVNITDSSMPLKVTFVYNDLPGINLINNLNLRVHSPSGKTYLGNDFQGRGEPDNVHNVEAVIEESPEVGDWTIEIVAQVVQSDESQQYVIVATGGGLSLDPDSIRTDRYGSTRPTEPASQP